MSTYCAKGFKVFTINFFSRRATVNRVPPTKLLTLGELQIALKGETKRLNPAERGLLFSITCISTTYRSNAYSISSAVSMIKKNTGPNKYVNNIRKYNS